MKITMVALTGIIFASLTYGCAQTNSQVLPPELSAQPTTAWSAEEHQEAADLLHEQAVRLEDKVANLDQRVERFDKNPYRDPKGLKRRMWKSRMGTYRTEIAELYEKSAWHHKEADRLNGVLVSAGQVDTSSLSSQFPKEWSAEEHREAADLLDEELVRLEAKVVHLDQRVERFNKKPYLDPKNKKREEWKEQIKAHREEILELRDQIVWHQKEADRLNRSIK